MEIKVNAADVEATNTSENTTAVSNKVATNNKDKIITKCDVPKQNITNEGGHVNVEGQNATLSKRWKSCNLSIYSCFSKNAYE